MLKTQGLQSDPKEMLNHHHHKHYIAIRGFSAPDINTGNANSRSSTGVTIDISSFHRRLAKVFASETIICLK